MVYHMVEIASILDKNNEDYAEDRTAAGFLAPLTTLEAVETLHKAVCKLTNDYLEKMHETLRVKQREQKKKMVGLDGGSTSAFLTVHGINPSKGESDLLIGSSNLADASSYLVVVKSRGKPRVIRLNSALHKPGDANERSRIEDAGGNICKEEERLNGVLAVAAAYGGYWLDKETGIPQLIRRDVEPELYSLRQLLRCYGVRKIEKLQALLFVNCCDGVVDIAPKGYESTNKKPSRSRRLSDEVYLERFFTNFAELHNVSLGEAHADEIGRALIAYAKGSGSKDNLSVNIAKLEPSDFGAESVYLWALDSHGGADVADCIAKGAHAIVSESIQQPPEAYKHFLSDGMEAGFCHIVHSTKPVHPVPNLGQEGLSRKIMKKVMDACQRERKQSG